MGTRRTLRRTFDSDRITLADLRQLAHDAYLLGLDDTAIVGFRPSYRGGWKIDATVHGESNAAIHIATESRTSQVPNDRAREGSSL